MPEISIQTDEFINYLTYEQKFRKLYELINEMAVINSEL